MRSGYVAANSMDIGPPSEAPISTAWREPAASMTARTSSILVSRLGMSLTRSESPEPCLSNTISREKALRRLKRWVSPGSSHWTSRLEMNPWTNTTSIGPSPTV